MSRAPIQDYLKARADSFFDWPGDDRSTVSTTSCLLFAEQVMGDMLGRQGMMAICAVRYCLGRQTYVVSDCADWLIAMWPAIPARAQVIIQRDVDEAFQRDDEGRADGSLYKALGMDCDRAEWERVRELWESNGLVPAGAQQ